MFNFFLFWKFWIEENLTSEQIPVEDNVSNTEINLASDNSTQTDFRVRNWVTKPDKAKIYRMKGESYVGLRRENIQKTKKKLFNMFRKELGWWELLAALPFVKNRPPGFVILYNKKTANICLMIFGKLCLGTLIYKL